MASYDESEIISRIENVIKEEEIRIINLESEDTGAYGIDINTSLTKLLWKIIPVLETNSKIRMSF